MNLLVYVYDILNYELLMV